MTTSRPESPETQETPTYWIPGLAAGLLAVACFGAYQFAETRDLRAEMAASQVQIESLQKALSGREGEFERKIAEIQRRSEAKEVESSSALSRAQAAVDRQTKALAAKLERQQRANEAAVNAELKRLQSESERSLSGVRGDVAEVKTDVADVRAEVATAQTGMQRTLADLTRVRGDLGVMSGLIATNSKEIAALRELGDRAIYEFALAKNNQLQRVGDIRVKVKKTDPKRNRYTMEILADDKLVEKKDRTTNEPVQFYVASRARIPYEIVVNEVGKGQIVGYLAVPKIATAKN
jgi:hypothetical protein